MHEISVDELKRRLESGAAVTVVDVRERPEHEAWSIHGSVNLPAYDSLRAGRDEPLRSQAASLPAGRPVVAVCKAGVISRRAAATLAQLGFEAASLSGGMRAWGGVWTEASMPLETAGAVGVQVRRNGKGCLSYLLASQGEAVVVDPSVDVAAYLAIAARLGATIRAVVETHVHADHLSRARALAEATGAALHLPANDRARFAFTPVRDGDAIAVGALRLTAVATPGHTLESTCYRVDDSNLLTGDTVFVGGFGRPDLERGDAGAGEAARLLHRSLTRRLRALPPAMRAWPAHHAHPVALDGVPVHTRLGEALDGIEALAMDEESFARSVAEALPPKPPNFQVVLAVNEGRAPLGELDPLDLEAGPNRCAAR
ncbi:MAG TPA: MBL fold metallo-hydrolase [Candidatus Polarisedimenticolaceae bacterium]